MPINRLTHIAARRLAAALGIAVLTVALLAAPRPAPAAITTATLKGLSTPQYYPPGANGFSPAIADQLAYLRVDMIRIEFIREPDGTMDFCPWDYIVDLAADRGTKTLGLIDYASLDSANSDEWATADYRQRFVARVQEIVAHYHDRPNPIRHWEIWNEPDLDLSGIGGPDFRVEPEPYALLLRDSFEAIKAIDPDATVVLGGLSPKGFYYAENYLADLYATTTMQDYHATHGRYPFDVVACHPYPDYTHDPDDFLADELNTKIKAVMNANGDRAKKVWLTEMGWTIFFLQGSIATREANQAQYLTESFEIVDALTDPDPQSAGLPPYVERYFWFRWNNFSEADQWGLIRDDGSLRPSYFAYRDLTAPGPEPPPPPGPGEYPPVAGTSDADLPWLDGGGQPIRVAADDLLNGLQPQLLDGGFHPATEPAALDDRLATLTDGQFSPNGLSVILNDYGFPSLHVAYTFAEPMDIAEVRLFAGHRGDNGNRAFINADVIANGALVKPQLRTGNYGLAPLGGDAVGMTRWAPEEGADFVTTNVTTLEFRFWCVSGVNAEGLIDPWDPCIDPLLDTDGAGGAYVASIIKEIDVIGQPGATTPTPTPTPTPTLTPEPTPTPTPEPTPDPTPITLLDGWKFF